MKDGKHTYIVRPKEEAIEHADNSRKNITRINIMPKLSKSTRPGKKYMAKFENKKTVFILARTGYRDRTTIKNADERNKAVKAYRARHKNDKLNDKMSPGALSFYVL